MFLLLLEPLQSYEASFLMPPAFLPFSPPYLIPLRPRKLPASPCGDVCVGLSMCNKLWAVSRQQLSFWLLISSWIVKPHTLQQNLLWPFFSWGGGVMCEHSPTKREFYISWLSVEYFFRCQKFFFSITFSSYNIMFWGLLGFFFLQFFHLLALVTHPSTYFLPLSYTIQARKGLEPIPAATGWGCQSVTEFEFIFDNVLFFSGILISIFVSCFLRLSQTHTRTVNLPVKK